ncbi:tail-specific protease [Desulfopila sp. IMCC35006]|uniref:carboxy terminal-processing peptidase n=1 Tax=Desulfopila sp. IMCC35006 TaxID=2569542 RepID=UPI0010AB698A|nr:carboxy terminal-processing peptidase [Desulfopila sp. IMCC35006]TKB28466.1 tail-specific protease [Desulfopila sp. IMCC35006]
MKNKKIVLVFCLTLLCLNLSNICFGDTGKVDAVDQKRNRLIGYILSKQLPALHFSDKVMGDKLSQATFYLYIKQLDYQKRFLLKKDVQQLEAFAPYIDNNLADGQITLPDTGYDILTEKIDLVQKMAGEMMASNKVVIGKPDSKDLYVGSFNVGKSESYETDPEKIDFAKNIAELRDRWRLVLKAQVISQYLDLEDAQKEKPESIGGQPKVKKPAAKKMTEEELWQEALAKVSKRNKNFFQRLRQENLQDHYDRFFNCVARAFGPHTNYIPPAGKEQFDINMRGSLEGIGALLREDDGFIKVIRIIPGSASARQGSLKAEDIILQVAQEGEEPVDITDMRLRDAVRLIRGPKGQAVILTVKRSDGVTEVIRIVRDVVQIEETFVKSSVMDSPDGRRTGYIFIPSFYRDFEGTRNGANGRNSTEDTLKEINNLKAQNVDGIVLDLRDDGGGALVDAVDITGLFIKSGPVVQVLNKYGDKRVLSDTNDGVSYDGPLVVLVNKFSASASEIVAAALQDYHRAVIVGGKHTHGKGTVQTIINLNENIPLLNVRKYEDLGALKVTIQKFYRVTGSSTQYKGVESDIVLPNLFEYIKSGERYLDYSLPWDSIAPVAFTAYKSKQPFNMAKLREMSLMRVAQDKGFKIISEEAARGAERSENTMLTVQIDDMRLKRDEARLMREKVGAYYRKYRDEAGDDPDFEGQDADQEDPKDKWLKDVKQDPYIREAVNIVGDIIRFSGK